MQTFLPFNSYIESARHLDNKRLGKQRVECKQILSCLLDIGSQSWKNHPAVKMWKGHEYSLALYTLAVCAEWRRRGFKDTVGDWASDMIDVMEITPHAYSRERPPWLGDERLHRSHRSNLVRKLPETYSAQFKEGTYDPSEPYWWPVH